MLITDLMFETEEVKKAAAGWEKAKLDAQSKGIELTQGYKSQGRTAWHLVVKDGKGKNDFETYKKKALERGVIFNGYITNPFQKTIFKLTDYKAAVDTIEAAVKNMDAYINDLLQKQHEEGYKWLQDKYDKSVSGGLYRPHLYQLFMPRPEVHNVKKREKWWPYRYDDEGNLREASNSVHKGSPILTGRMTSPPGDNKPGNAFWTSNLIDMKDGTYSSPWVQYTLGNADDWWNPIGYVYKVSPEARILPFRDSHDAVDIYRHYAMMGSKVDIQALDSTDRHDYSSNMRKDFPWADIAKNWDGVYHPSNGRGYGYDHPFQYGWDVPSTAWLNTDVLEFIREVKISKSSDSD